LKRVEVPDLDSLLQPSGRHFIPAALAARLGLPEPHRAGS
jgi:hypothetical protein